MAMRFAISVFALLLFGSVGFVCPGNSTSDDVLEGFDIAGKLAVVTGGDSGLGYSIASSLAKKGVQVIIATHNFTKGQHAARELAKATGAKVLSPWPLDLSSLTSVRAFASNFNTRYGHKLNFLINDAGIGGPSILAKNGYELVFEVDYLGHFLLTELLLPALRSSSPARVINVASGAHENACEAAGWPEGCFKDWTYLPPPVVPRKNVTVHYKNGPGVTQSSSYGIAKFLMIQHAAELAKREWHSRVEAFSLTPGFAITSMTQGFDPDSPSVKRICEEQRHPDGADERMPANPCPFSADQGAAAIAACAAHLAPSGAYISRSLACAEAPVVTHGMSNEMRSELYSRSLSWVGLEDAMQTPSKISDIVV